ncbi:MAG: hypothetical protein ABIS06_04350 [Vicinamibacterales bacterium]
MLHGRVLLAAGLALSLTVSAQTTSHLVMVSVDGLMPSSYTGAGAGRFPILKSLKDQGAYAEGVIGVLPSVKTLGNLLGLSLSPAADRAIALRAR